MEGAVKDYRIIKRNSMHMRKENIIRYQPYRLEKKKKHSYVITNIEPKIETIFQSTYGGNGLVVHLLVPASGTRF